MRPATPPWSSWAARCRAMSDDNFRPAAPRSPSSRTRSPVRLPTLGICLGAQLLAAAAARRSTAAQEAEIGWRPVTLTDAAAKDPLFTGVDGPLDVLQWHRDTFDLPRGEVCGSRSRRSIRTKRSGSARPRGVCSSTSRSTRRPSNSSLPIPPTKRCRPGGPLGIRRQPPPRSQRLARSSATHRKPFRRRRSPRLSVVVIRMHRTRCELSWRRLRSLIVTCRCAAVRRGVAR